MNEKNKFLQGALYLSLAGVISKILSAMYRVPLQNLTGDLGFYTYQQVYPFIGIVMVLGLYGFPQAISKLMAEGNHYRRRALFWPMMLSLYAVNGLLAAICFVFAEPLAHLMADASLASAYRMLGFVFLLLPLLAYLRGEAQGRMSMMPTAVSQVIEQLIRVVIIVVSAYLIFAEKLQLESIGLFAVYASIASMVVAIIALLIIRAKRGDKASENIKSKSVNFKYIFKNILVLGFFGASTHMILLWLQMIDVFTLVPSFLKAGLPLEHAKELKGIFDRGQPLIQFGVVIGSSFALALIPSVVKTAEDRTRAITEAFTFGFYLAGAATVGLFILMPEVNQLLFMDHAGTASLRILSLSIFFTTLIITLGTIIQTSYSMMIVAAYLILTALVKFMMNIWLVPLYGIEGSAIATVISLLVLTGLLTFRLKRFMSGIHLFRKINYKAYTLGLILMASLVTLSKIALIPTTPLPRIFLAVLVLGLIGLGALSYMLVLFKYRVFTMKQIQVLPFSSKIIFLMDKFKNKWVKK